MRGRAAPRARRPGPQRGRAGARLHQVLEAIRQVARVGLAAVQRRAAVRPARVLRIGVQLRHEQRGRRGRLRRGAGARAAPHVHKALPHLRAPSGTPHGAATGAGLAAHAPESAPTLPSFRF